jgi:hypothetical protein
MMRLESQGQTRVPKTSIRQEIATDFCLKTGSFKNHPNPLRRINLLYRDAIFYF